MQFWLNLGFIREVEQLPALAVDLGQLRVRHHHTFESGHPFHAFLPDRAGFPSVGPTAMLINVER